MAHVGYCTIDFLKRRLLIELTDSTYDTQLGDAVSEASTWLDEQIREFINTIATTFPTFQFSTLPLSTVPEELQYVVADYASELFRRRHMPKSFDEQHFKQEAIRKLNWFIKVNWKNGEFYFVMSTSSGYDEASV